jgi:hypothetical protein
MTQSADVQSFTGQAAATHDLHIGDGSDLRAKTLM